MFIRSCIWFDSTQMYAIFPTPDLTSQWFPEILWLYCHHFRSSVMNHHCPTLLLFPTGIRSRSDRFPVARFLSNVVNKKTGTSGAASSQLMCACSGWLACNEVMEPHSFSIRPEKRESAREPSSSITPQALLAFSLHSNSALLAPQ